MKNNTKPIEIEIRLVNWGNNSWIAVSFYKLDETDTFQRLYASYPIMRDSVIHHVLKKQFFRQRNRVSFVSKYTADLLIKFLRIADMIAYDEMMKLLDLPYDDFINKVRDYIAIYYL